MSTPREIFLEMLKPDGRPERILDQYEALAMMTGDPINRYLRGNRVRGTTSVDRWGTTILFPADAPGPMPDTRDELKVLKDITRVCPRPGHRGQLPGRLGGSLRPGRGSARREARRGLYGYGHV